jgi:hypothetical protein
VALQRKGVKRLIRRLWEIYPQIAASRERIALRQGAPGDQTLYMTEQIPMKKVAKRAKAGVPGSC